MVLNDPPVAPNAASLTQFAFTKTQILPFRQRTLRVDPSSRPPDSSTPRRVDFGKRDVQSRRRTAIFGRPQALRSEYGDSHDDRLRYGQGAARSRIVDDSSAAGRTNHQGNISMKCFILRLAALLIGLCFWSSTAEAQWRYPRGYGGYGMSQWGADPGAGYMAGLGAYARGQGVYQLEKAKADAINVDTMAKWNKALRARQAALREDKRKEADKKEDSARGRGSSGIDLQDGTTLNTPALPDLRADPTAARSGRSKAPLSADMIREIPFEWDSEALTICIDQMTGDDVAPRPADGRRSIATIGTPCARPSSPRSRKTPRGPCPRRPSSESTTRSRVPGQVPQVRRRTSSSATRTRSTTSPRWPACRGCSTTRA